MNKKENFYYKAINKDHFYYTVIDYLQSLKKSHNTDDNFPKDKDELWINLLYIVARKGFNDICEFLMEEGIMKLKKLKAFLYIELDIMSKYQLLIYYDSWNINIIVLLNQNYFCKC